MGGSVAPLGCVRMDVHQLAPGLWRWTAAHPAWRPGHDWPREVGCVYVEAPDATVLVDPLVPADDEERFWSALDRDVERRALPVVVLLTCAWHRRSTDAVVDRYSGRVWPDGAPLPSDIDAERFAEGDWEEHVFVLRDHAALVFGDVVEADETGRLRMPPNWWPADAPRTAQVRRELRRLLDRPIELVLVSHGSPVLADGHAALAQALEM